MNNNKGWSLTLPIKGIAVLIIMAVHSQPYQWWLYLLVGFASLHFERK